MDEKLPAIQARNACERLGIAICFHTALHSTVKTLRGEYVEAESKLNVALELFSNMNTHYPRGQTLFELGDIAAARTSAPQAHDYFTRALDDVERIGAAPDTIRVRERLAAL